MSRNPMAASLRAHKPKRIEDKRDKAEIEALDEEAATYITFPGKVWERR